MGCGGKDARYGKLSALALRDWVAGEEVAHGGEYMPAAPRTSCGPHSGG